LKGKTILAFFLPKFFGMKAGLASNKKIQITPKPQRDLLFHKKLNSYVRSKKKWQERAGDV
jgi:hypothetical protein